jgi:hypothetical protein
MLKELVYLLALCVTNSVALDNEQYPTVQHEGSPSGEVKVFNNGIVLILDSRSNSLTICS